MLMHIYTPIQPRERPYKCNRCIARNNVDEKSKCNDSGLSTKPRSTISSNNDYLSHTQCTSSLVA